MLGERMNSKDEDLHMICSYFELQKSYLLSLDDQSNTY